MQLADFRRLVHGLLADVPPAYRDGVVDVEVSPRTVPHPARAGVYTLGECIPLEWSAGGADLQSRVVLYHGSFAALARGDAGFDWRGEAWETLTHELRHHLEWRADYSALEAYDWAGEQNFARHEGAPFDPAFPRSGETVAPGVWKVDDDVFVEADAPAGAARVEFIWHGARYRAELPAALARPAFVTVDGLAETPPGDVVVVLGWRARPWDLWRRAPAPASLRARAEAVRG